MTPQEKYIEVLEWLYEEDGNYDSRSEWRADLLQNLRSLAGVDEEELCE